MSSGMDARIVIEPVPGESHEARQWGYTILLDGHPYLHVRTAGPGPLWDIADPLRACDLDDMIAALVALRASDLHAEHLRRWGA